ncbi:MAG: hypothetical protein ABI593_07110 [Betaproteobacteria bacterium]
MQKPEVVMARFVIGGRVLRVLVARGLTGCATPPVNPRIDRVEHAGYGFQRGGTNCAITKF